MFVFFCRTMNRPQLTSECNGIAIWTVVVALHGNEALPKQTRGQDSNCHTNCNPNLVELKMSLFKACTWWSTQCPDYEESYDSLLLHCCRFGLENGEKDCICVGSHSGYLSIFQPIRVEGSSNVMNDFKPTDLLLEIKLPNPILEITSGTFLM